MEKIINKIQNDDILQKISTILEKNNCFLVGGFIRDLFLNKASHDRDIIVIDEDAKEIALKIQDILDAHFVELDSENKIYRVIDKNKIDYIDVAQAINNNLIDDIKRRDLTINALVYDFRKREIIDLVNGISDIKNKRIELIKEENFYDDSLRMLRACRFQASLNFEISLQIKNFVKKNYMHIQKIAKERITYELIKLFDGKYADIACLSLEEMKLLEFLIPEFKEIKKIPPNSHHHLDLFHHLVETVKQIQIHYENSNDIIKNHLEKKDLGEFRRLAYLKFAGFLHDIGKPSTWTIEEDTKRHRFMKHDDVGSKIVVPRLKDFKFSNKQIKYISNIIKYHIYPSQVVMPEDVTTKTWLRYFRKTEDNSLDLILIAKADRLSALGEEITQEILNNNLNNLAELENFYIETYSKMKPLEKLLDGKEIMKILNISQGVELGKVIKELKEAQINSIVVTKDDAIKFVKDFKNISKSC